MNRPTSHSWQAQLAESEDEAMRQAKRLVQTTKDAQEEAEAVRAEARRLENELRCSEVETEAATAEMRRLQAKRSIFSGFSFDVLARLCRVPRV